MKNLNYWKTKQLCLTAILLSLIVLSRFLTFVTANIFMGYGIQFHYIFYSLALLLVVNWKYKLFIYLFTPIFLLVFGFTTNPILDYIIAMYGFGGFMFIKCNNKFDLNKWIQLVVFSLIGFFIAFIANTISGIIFFKVTFICSVSFNGIFNLVNLIIFIPLLFIIINSLIYNNFLISLKDYHEK